jgi:hypothetical protein
MEFLNLMLRMILEYGGLHIQVNPIAVLEEVLIEEDLPQEDWNLYEEDIPHENWEKDFYIFCEYNCPVTLTRIGEPHNCVMATYDELDEGISDVWW